MVEKIPAARATWSGAIRVGLVAVPIKLYTNASERDVKFVRLDAEDLSRIRVKNVRESDRAESQGSVRAFEYARGSYVVVSDEELAALALKQDGHSVNIGGFVPSDAVDTRMIEKTYLVGPDEGGGKAYALLREAMVAEGVVALATVIMRDKEKLCMLVPDGERIALHMLFWPDELKAPVFDLPSVVLAEEELAMARLLVNNLRSDAGVAEYRDRYREEVLAFIDRKVTGIDEPAAEAATPKDDARDLMDALRASIAAHRKAG